MQNDAFSSDYSAAPIEGNDRELWLLAKRRAGFKMAVITYVAINCMLIAIWYFTSGPGSYFWPFWSLLGWGIGLASRYYRAYYTADLSGVQKEYNKLKNQQKN